MYCFTFLASEQIFLCYLNFLQKCLQYWPLGLEYFKDFRFKPEIHLQAIERFAKDQCAVQSDQILEQKVAPK